jgi:putative transposase
MRFKQQLPQLEKPKGKYFITFVTWERLELNKEARQVVLDACKFFHGQRYELFAAVIMVDHVHLLIQPFPKSETEYWSIGSILHSIKSYSSKQIPQVMLHIGKVWQDGRYDEMIRSEEEFNNKWEYIRQNPVKAGLSKTPEEYPFLWETF